MDIEKQNEIINKRLNDLLDKESQKAFSDKSGVSIRLMNRWLQKKSKPRLYHIILLADFFNCKVDYLLGIDK